MTELKQQNSDVLNLGEAARFIRVSERTLGQLARNSKVPCQRVGREWRFLRTALESWLRREMPSFPESVEAPALTEPPKADGTLSANGAGFKDTAFTLNRRQPLHRWVPWIAGFSAEFVDDILKRASGPSKKRLTVIDPFAGVGTTLVEAMLQDHRPIGFEINPYAALACRLKLASPDFDVAELRSAVKRFEDFRRRVLRMKMPAARSVPPVDFHTRVRFFSPRIERMALFALDFIRTIPQPWIADLFRLAFGSVMVSCSNYTYEPSLGTRQAAGKPNIDDAPIAVAISSKVSEMAEDIEFVQQAVGRKRTRPKPLVLQESYLDGATAVPEHSVDLLITSPPYLNNYHYVRNTRPQLHWLNLIGSQEELRKLEQTSFGKFWQTVRSGPNVELDFSYPELAEVIKVVAEQNPDRGQYGGRGWANYAATYFNDCLRFWHVTKRVLATGGTAVVVIGNNILQGIEVKSDLFLAGIAEKAGFEVVAIHCVREKRTGSSIINSSVRVGELKHRIRLYESAVEVRAR
jgi:excisionase family DNA binding protein